jgi:hypothetical protein
MDHRGPAVRAAAALVLGTWIAACGDSPRGVTEPGPEADLAVRLVERTATLHSLGDTLWVAATIQDGKGRLVSGTVTLRSLDPEIAEAGAGWVVSRDNGLARVEAHAPHARPDTLEITVYQAIATLEVVPSDLALKVGESMQMVALAHDARGHVVTRPYEVEWSVTDEQPADSFVRQPGLRFAETPPLPSRKLWARTFRLAGADPADPWTRSLTADG